MKLRILNFITFTVYVGQRDLYHVALRFVTVSEKTDHLAPMQFVQYGPKSLQRSLSKDFEISMPRCSTAS